MAREKTKVADEAENAAKAAATETGMTEKVLKGSFWVIAAIHVTVFTAIGAATRQWRLLIVFLIGFAAVMAAWAVFKLWRARKNRTRHS